MSDQVPLFVGSEIYRKPAFGPNHPLNIVRHAAVVDLLTMLGWLNEDNFRRSEAATLSQLTEFHDRSYIRALQYANATGQVAAEARERYQIGTFENPMFPNLFERAATAVGGSILAAKLAVAGHVVFHPSGGTHHGRPDRASGFCYLNDPVFALRTLLELGRENVMYLDFDAHHGDGVEDAFFGDGRVTTVSLHETKRWPFSGTHSHQQAGAYNFSVPRGFTDSEFEYVLEHAILPLVAQTRPDALVLCCGADCLAGDPLSSMELSNVTLWDAVDQFIGLGLPIVILGGGGYNPWTVARYWAGMWGRICGREIPVTLPEEATAYLAEIECDLIDEDDVDPAWLTTMADTPYPGPIRDEIKLLAQID